MPAPNNTKRPHDHIARWAREPKTTSLVSQFTGAPRTVNVRASDGAGVDELRALLVAANAPGENIDRALSEAVSSSEEDGGGIVSVWTCSTRAVDSYDTTFNPDGWVLDAFRLNPVVLWAHERDALPIGRDIGAWVQPGKALMGVTRYAGPDLNPFADAVARMVKARFLSAVSIGFQPIEWTIADERDTGESFFMPVDFIRQKLDEYSVVPVPANPEALVEGRNIREAMKAEGVDPRLFVDWIERALDGELTEGKPLNVPRVLLERARKAVITVGDGLVLGPPDLVRVPETDGAAAQVGEEVGADVADDGVEVLACPECGYTAPSEEFVRAEDETPAEASEEELRAADELSDEALRATLTKRGFDVCSRSVGDTVDSEDEAVAESMRTAIAKRAAETAARVTREMIAKTGVLPD